MFEKYKFNYLNFGLIIIFIMVLILCYIPYDIIKAESNSNIDFRQQDISPIENFIDEYNKTDYSIQYERKITDFGSNSFKLYE